MRSAPRTTTGDAHPFSADAQAPLIAAMMDPQFYPRRVSGVEHVETHISHVFLAGDLVYKVKKAVRYSFLDYSTLKRRKYFLQEELRLNRRLAPSVYLGILPISHANGRWQLGSDVAPAEYALAMRRLPARRMLDCLLARGQATPSMMRGLAELLASFHAHAPTGGRIDARGSPETVQRVWNDNLADLRPFIRGSDDLEKFTALRRFGGRFIVLNRELMLRRVREGRIRDGHGDLHCEHICFAPEGIQIFDCVEFSSRLRRCDVASEVAFLAMDAEHRGGAELVGVFLRRYAELAGDPEMWTLLPLYQSYRALVRAKVDALRCGEFSPLAREYFEYACRPVRASWGRCLVLFCGLSASGKSTLAREFGRRSGWPVVSSDRVRRALFPGPGGRGGEGYEEGRYAPAKTAATYDEIAREAARFLGEGSGVIVDATLQKQRQRERMIGLASEHHVPAVFVLCRAPEEVARRRFIERLREGSDPSEADWEIYVKQKAAFEPFAEAGTDLRLRLDTDAPVSELCRKVENYLTARLPA